MNVEIYTFINMPENEFHTGSDIYRIRLYDMIDQLCSLNEKLEYMYWDKKIANIKIKLLSGRGRTIKKITDNITDFNNCEILLFSIDFNEKNQEIELSGRTVVLFLEKTVQEIFLIANMCVLGSIEYKNSLVFVNNKVTDIKLSRMNVWPLQRAFELTQKIGWPKPIEIDFFTAWNWFKNHEDYMDGFINNKTSRAINAFSRVITFHQHEWDEAIQLLWSLVGIEALYVEEKTGIMEQMREKIFTLFGEPTSHKKIINNMYKFRSKFIHGTIDFPGFSFIYDAMEKFERYTDEQIETINIAIVILGSSLQYIIKNNWSGLEFKRQYIISDITKKGS